MKKYVYAILIALFMSGCVGAGYNALPEDKKNAISDIAMEYDKFKGTYVIETPMYLIRDGFTDTFPVVLGLKAEKKSGKLQYIKIKIKIIGTEKGLFYSAIGEDGYKFNFEFLSSNDASTISTTSHFGSTSYTASNPMKRDIFDLYLTKVELEKIAKSDYEIKIYGKNREGTFKIPKKITSAFLEALSL